MPGPESEHHRHDHDPLDPALLHALDGRERHELRPVGVDIGSATSHLAIKD